MYVVKIFYLSLMDRETHKDRIMIFTDESHKLLDAKQLELRNITDYSEGIPSGVVIFSKRYQEYIAVTRSDTAFTEVILLKRSPNWRAGNYSVMKFPTKILVGEDYQGDNSYFMGNFSLNGSHLFIPLSPVLIDHIGTDGLSVLASQYNIYLDSEKTDIKEAVAVVDIVDSISVSVINKAVVAKTVIRFVQARKAFLKKTTVIRQEMEIKEFFKKYAHVSTGLCGW